MYDNLHIEEMRNALGNKTEITIKDIDDFYCRYSPNIPFSTVKWRIHSLINNGFLHRIGHGRYRFGEEKIFFPDIFRKTMDIARIMRKQFPFADYCQWNFSAVNAFAHHLLNTELYFVDVERDAREAVYYAIRDKYPKTVLSSNLNDELAYYDGCIVVRNLITDAPVITVEDIPMASIEKILVDRLGQNVSVPEYRDYPHLRERMLVLCRQHQPHAPLRRSSWPSCRDRRNT